MEEIGEKILNSIYGGQDPLVSIFGSIGPDDIDKLVTEFQHSPWAQLLKPQSSSDKKVEENPWVKLFTNNGQHVNAPCVQKANVPCGQKVNVPCGQKQGECQEEATYHSLWSQVRNKEKSQYPPVDIRVMETYVGVYIDIPTVPKELIQVSVRGKNELIIEFDRDLYGNSSDSFLLKERPSGSFKRVIKLPDGIDTNAKTYHKDGVLLLEFSKLSCIGDKTIKKINIS